MEDRKFDRSVTLHAAPGYAETARLASNVPLYGVAMRDGQATLFYDGFRAARVGSDAVVSDATSSGVDSLDALAASIGVFPDLTLAQVGEFVGDALNDLVVASLTFERGVVVSIQVEKRLPRPNVGLGWYGEPELNDVQLKTADALLRNGARVTLTPEFPTYDSSRVLSELDGLFVPGGVDLDPALYGEAPCPFGSVSCNRARDASDVFMLRRALALNLPTYTVCRGTQALNVALGGGLIQDVPSYQARRLAQGLLREEETSLLLDDPPATEEERRATKRVFLRGYFHGSGRKRMRHALGSYEQPAISDKSKFLAPIVGRRYYPSVYSSHHQAVDPDRLGDGLTIVARTEDGIVEALEYQANDFVLATQFHVEYDTLNDDVEIARFSNSFVRALIERSRKTR